MAKPTIETAPTASDEREKHDENPWLLIHAHQQDAWAVRVYRRNVDRYHAAVWKPGFRYNTREYATAFAALEDARDFVASMIESLREGVVS